MRSIIISLGVSLLTTASSGAIEGNPESIESLINVISSSGGFIKFIPTLIPAVNALTSNNILIQILNGTGHISMELIGMIMKRNHQYLDFMEKIGMRM